MKLMSRPICVMVLMVPLAMASMGGGCSVGGLVPILPGGPPVVVLDSVDVVFNNETPYDVDAFVNGQYLVTVPAGVFSAPIVFDCGIGSAFDFDADLLTGAGAFPSQNVLGFDEGVQFFCGDVIQVNFFLDINGALALDGGAG